MADQPIGHVVGADFIYDEQSPGMLQSGVLLKEIDELIRGLRVEGEDGELKSRICALIFLISQIPTRTIGGETGLRATAPFIADLLVEDLADDGATLRKRVPELLDELVADGRAHAHRRRVPAPDRRGRGMGEGLPQPPRRDPRRRHPHEPASQRAAQRAVEAALGGLKLTHGASKTPRKIEHPLGPGRAGIQMRATYRYGFATSGRSPSRR